VQLMTEGEDVQFQIHPVTEAAGNNRNDRTHECEYADDIAAVSLKTLGFFAPFGVFSSHNLVVDQSLREMMISLGFEERQ
jgi:hypothetical protein